MNDSNNPIVAWLWSLMASIAGAISALSFRPFKDMTASQVSLAVFVGATFSLFVAPLITYIMFRGGPIDLRLQGAIFYLMATGANSLIPRAVKWLGRAFGSGEEPRP